MTQMQLTSLLERQEQDIIYSSFVIGTTSRTFVLVQPYRTRVGGAGEAHSYFRAGPLEKNAKELPRIDVILPFCGKILQRLSSLPTLTTQINNK